MKDLYILPFDHRSAFQKALLGKTTGILPDEHAFIRESKLIIYNSFKYIIEKGTSKENLALLVDEEYGSEILEKAKTEKIIRILTVEKSGQDEFEFEYGADFKDHILKFKPDYAKILIRYNPEGNINLNNRQRTKIKLLHDFCKEVNIKLLIEVLMVPTEKQFADVGNDEYRFGTELKPRLLKKMIEEFSSAKIVPSVWKLEGLWKKADYEMLCQTAGKDAGIVVLGTGVSKADADKLFTNAEIWLSEGSKVPNVIGFAVGRIVFMQSIKRWAKKELSADEASRQIADNFYHFWKLFLKSRKS